MTIARVPWVAGCGTLFRFGKSGLTRLARGPVEPPGTVEKASLSLFRESW
ncbi:hypothetical protein IG631_04712 [Alternaria alternata]|nr:hypothetical protein IG631_04712 [Alternaria alternata]